MHEKFGEWYRAVHPDPTSEQLSLRWERIVKLCSSLDKAMVFELGRIFHGLQKTNAKVTRELRTHFQENDKTFKIEGNDLEIAVLSGATLTAAFKTNYADEALYSLLCPVPPGVECNDYRSGILSNAEDVIEIRSRNLRKGVPEVREIPSLDKDFDTKIEALSADWAPPDLPQVGKSVVQVLKAMQKTFKEWHEFQENLSYEKSLLIEDSNILWWFVAESSESLQKPWKSIDQDVVSIVCARELSELTENIPGPVSQRAILRNVVSKAIGKPGDKFSVETAVNKLGRDWRESVAEEIRDVIQLDLCPIHYAMVKSTETTDTKAWPSFFAASFSSVASTNVSAFQLAVQVFRESLFLSL